MVQASWSPVPVRECTCEHDVRITGEDKRAEEAAACARRGGLWDTDGLGGVVVASRRTPSRQPPPGPAGPLWFARRFKCQVRLGRGGVGVECAERWVELLEAAAARQPGGGEGEVPAG